MTGQSCLEDAPPRRCSPPSGQRRAELEAVDCIVALVYERPRIRLSRDKEALVLHSDKTHVAHN
jgi:hypothetical protein